MDQDFGEDADLDAALLAADKAAAASTTASSSLSKDASTKIVQPKPQSLASRQGPSAILVSTRQKGNPLLQHIRSLPWEYSDTPADYILGATTCALFLSLKYHRLHPEYIYTRIKALGKLYGLRILLARVDVDNHEEALRELSKTSVVNDFTLILCWSEKEAARYLELFKSYEHASPASIKAHQPESYQESLTEFITTPRSINKTDATSLMSNYENLRAAINAPPEELAFIPGWGEKKVNDWSNAVRENFRVRTATKVAPGAPRVYDALTLDATDGNNLSAPGQSPSQADAEVAGNEELPNRALPSDGHTADLRPYSSENRVAVNAKEKSGETMPAGVAAALAKLRNPS